MPTSNQNLARADLVLADLENNGGYMQPEQANRFIDFIYEEPTILRQARMVRMAGPEMKINRMGFGSRILRAASQTGGAEDDGSNGRYLTKANRSKPTTAQIELKTSEVIAEIRIPYEVLEDNIEGQSFESHVMRAIATRVAVDLEELGIWGDTASVDTYLALQDGWMKRASAHVLDNLSAGITPDTFASALLTLPQKYLRNLPQMRAYISEANRIKYQQAVSRRLTGYGDAAVQENLPLVAHGLKIEAAALLSSGGGESGLVTYPQNLIWGVQRQISIETDKDIRSREYIIVVTARVALQIDDVDATVKMTNLGGLAPVPGVNVTIVNTLANPVITDEKLGDPA